MLLVSLLAAVAALRTSRVPRAASKMAETVIYPPTPDSPSVERARAAADGVVDVSASAPRVLNTPPYSPLKAANSFYSAWNHGDYDDAAMQLTESVIFRDINFPEPFVGRESTRQYLKECTENLIGWSFCIDDWAEDKERNRLGLYWHVNDIDGNELMLPTKGISFLTLSEDNSLLAECTDINEPFLKIPLLAGSTMMAAAQQANSLAEQASSLAAPFLSQIFGSASPLASQLPSADTDVDAEEEQMLAGSAIAVGKAFFVAWNAGNIDKAAALLTEDVRFCDPNFDAPFVGRAAAAEYLQQCTSVLNGWQFIVDDWAEDKPRSRLGLKWHVEDAQGITIPLPNLGVSFLKLNPDLSQISEVTDHMEPVSVPPPELQLPLVATVSMALELRRKALAQLRL